MPSMYVWMPSMYVCLLSVYVCLGKLVLLRTRSDSLRNTCSIWRLIQFFEICEGGYFWRSHTCIHTYEVKANCGHFKFSRWRRRNASMAARELRKSFCGQIVQPPVYVCMSSICVYMPSMYAWTPTMYVCMHAKNVCMDAKHVCMFTERVCMFEGNRAPEDEVRFLRKTFSIWRLIYFFEICEGRYFWRSHTRIHIFEVKANCGHFKFMYVKLVCIYAKHVCMD